MNILSWQILFLFMSIFQSIHEYHILIWNIYKEYEYISLWLCLPCKFFKWKIYKSKKKDFCLKFFWEKIDISYLWIICKYFPSDKYYSYSYLQVLEFTNYSYSYLYRSCLRQYIPIPIIKKNYHSLITEVKSTVYTHKLRIYKSVSTPNICTTMGTN